MTVLPEVTSPALDLRARITLRFECFRALGQGVLDTVGIPFILLIADRHFQASDTMKSIASVNINIGLLLSPLVVTFVIVHRFKASRAAAALMFIGGLAFSIAAIIPTLYALIWASLLGMTCTVAAIPLITQIYQDNYPAALRGELFSRQNFIRISTTIAFGWLAGRFLKTNMNDFQFLVGVFAVAAFFSAYSLLRIPSSPLTDPGRNARNPFYALKFVRDDKLFRNTLISWMLMGLANLMMVPLRVEYLSNTERFGITLNGEPLSETMVVFLALIIPSVARLIMGLVFGKIFDRINFFLFRILVNLGFGIAILTFFTGNSLVGHLIGATIWGVSIAGGDICWSLWVTRLAPPHRVAHYMSVHTFCTGIRGLAAPFLAFYFLTRLGLNGLAVLTTVMIVASCLILFPEIFNKKREN